MQVDVVTLFPELVMAVTGHGVTGRAVQRGLLTVQTWNPRDYARGAHRSVDDRAYGGGPGMVMQVVPLRAAVRAARAQAPGGARTVYLSPQGSLLRQARVRALSAGPGVILVAGRYEGVDERFVESEVDEEWSIGDYVLSGGELPAMVVIDALARQLPGALGDAASAEQDSFSDGLLDYPHYTRPERVGGRGVPPVLLSGDHAQIARWRRRQALGRTWERRPELLARLRLSAEDGALLKEYRRERGERARAADAGDGNE